MASDDQVLSGTGVLGEDAIALEVDGSKAINEAGIFGEQESFRAAFRDTEAFYEVLPDAPTWLRLSLKEASTVAGVDIGQLRELSVANPNVLLTLFTRVDAEGPVGPVELDGEPMARFDIPVDMGREWPPAVQLLADVLLDEFGINSMDVSLWVDADNQLRRIEQSFGYSVGGADDPSVEVTVTIDVRAEPTDGAPEIPDESEIRTLDDFSG